MPAAQDDEVEEEVSRSRRKEASQYPQFMLSLGRWIAAFTGEGGGGGYMKLLGIEGL